MLNPEPEAGERKREPRNWQAAEEMQMADSHLKRNTPGRSQGKVNLDKGPGSPIRWANIRDSDNIEPATGEGISEPVAKMQIQVLEKFGDLVKSQTPLIPDTANPLLHTYFQAALAQVPEHFGPKESHGPVGTAGRGAHPGLRQGPAARSSLQALRAAWAHLPPAPPAPAPSQHPPSTPYCCLPEPQAARCQRRCRLSTKPLHCLRAPSPEPKP